MIDRMWSFKEKKVTMFALDKKIYSKMSIDMRSADEKQHAQYNTATKTLKNDLDVLQ